jgi:hypothetical protein
MGADVLVERVLVLERFPALLAAQIFGLNLVQEPTKIRDSKLKQVEVSDQNIQGPAVTWFF